MKEIHRTHTHGLISDKEYVELLKTFEPKEVIVKRITKMHTGGLMPNEDYFSLLKELETEEIAIEKLIAYYKEDCVTAKEFVLLYVMLEGLTLSKILEE